MWLLIRLAGSVELASRGRGSISDAAAVLNVKTWTESGRGQETTKQTARVFQAHLLQLIFSRVSFPSYAPGGCITTCWRARCPEMLVLQPLRDHIPYKKAALCRTSSDVTTMFASRRRVLSSTPNSISSSSLSGIQKHNRRSLRIPLHQ